MSGDVDTWAVVPLRWPGEPKSRLSTLLTLKQRRALALAMFGDVVMSLLAVIRADRIVIVSRGALPKRFLPSGVHCIVDEKCGYNNAAATGHKYTCDQGAGATMVIPGDLPLLCAEDIARIIHQLQIHDIVLVPDRVRSGTNLIAIKRPANFTFRYGQQSFRRHLSFANDNELSICVEECASLALDIDSQSDLHVLANSPGSLVNPLTADLIEQWRGDRSIRKGPT